MASKGSLEAISAAKADEVAFAGGYVDKAGTSRAAASRGSTAAISYVTTDVEQRATTVSERTLPIVTNKVVSIT